MIPFGTYVDISLSRFEFDPNKIDIPLDLGPPRLGKRIPPQEHIRLDCEYPLFLRVAGETDGDFERSMESWKKCIQMFFDYLEVNVTGRTLLKVWSVRWEEGFIPGFGEIRVFLEFNESLPDGIDMPIRTLSLDEWLPNLV